MTRALLATALLAVALLGAVRAWQISMQTSGIDFYQFWALAQAVEERRVVDIWDPAARRHLAGVFLRRANQSEGPLERGAAGFRSGELEAAATPFLYTVFSALETGHYDRDVGRYRALSLGLACLALAGLCWLLQTGALQAAAALAFTTWAWLPIGDDLVVGNVNQLQLALLSLFLLLQRRARELGASVAAGAVLGLANAFKPNLSYVLLALTLGWGVDRSWSRLLRCWAGVALGAGVAVVLSSRFFGTPRCWLDWLELLRGLESQYDLGLHWGNFGGARLLAHFLGLDLAWLLELVGWGVLLAALLRSRARRDAAGAPADAFRREYLLVAAGAILPMLTTGLAWPHYLVLALPMVLYAFVAPPEWARSRGHPRVFVALALAALAGVLALVPLAWLGLYDPALRAVGLAGGSLLLFGLALGELSRPG